MVTNPDPSWPEPKTVQQLALALAALDASPDLETHPGGFTDADWPGLLGRLMSVLDSAALRWKADAGHQEIADKTPQLLAGYASATFGYEHQVHQLIWRAQRDIAWCEKNEHRSTLIGHAIQTADATSCLAFAEAFKLQTRQAKRHGRPLPADAAKINGYITDTIDALESTIHGLSTERLDLP